MYPARSSSGAPGLPVCPTRRCGGHFDGCGGAGRGPDPAGDAVAGGRLAAQRGVRAARGVATTVRPVPLRRAKPAVT